MNMKRAINWVKGMGKLESAVLYLFFISFAVWLGTKFIKSNITSDILTICLFALLIASAALFVFSLKALLERKAISKKSKKRK